MINNLLYCKLALIRYVLIPNQLVAFEFGYTQDSYEFENYFRNHLDKSISRSYEFISVLESGLNEESYQRKCLAIVCFVDSLPFLEHSSINDLEEYNPFDDFDESEVDAYLNGKQVPLEFNIDDDEASIFYAANPGDVYGWYNSITEKSLVEIVKIYVGLLEKLKS